MTILLGIFDYQLDYMKDDIITYHNFPGGMFDDVEDRVKWACEKASENA